MAYIFSTATQSPSLYFLITHATWHYKHDDNDVDGEEDDDEVETTCLLIYSLLTYTTTTNLLHNLCHCHYFAEAAK